MVNVVTRALHQPFISALQHPAAFTAAECSALQCAKNQGRESEVCIQSAPWHHLDEDRY